MKINDDAGSRSSSLFVFYTPYQVMHFTPLSHIHDTTRTNHNPTSLQVQSVHSRPPAHAPFLLHSGRSFPAWFYFAFLFPSRSSFHVSCTRQPGKSLLPVDSRKKDK